LAAVADYFVLRILSVRVFLHISPSISYLDVIESKSSYCAKYRLENNHFPEEKNKPTKCTN